MALNMPENLGAQGMHSTPGAASSRLTGTQEMNDAGVMEVASSCARWRAHAPLVLLVVQQRHVFKPSTQLWEGLDGLVQKLRIP